MLFKNGLNEKKLTLWFYK